MAVLRRVQGINGADDEDIEHQTAEIVTFFDPQRYNGEQSIEIKQDREFERMCIYISQHTNLRAKDMSVSEFYNAYDYLSEESKQIQKSRR